MFFIDKTDEIISAILPPSGAMMIKCDVCESKSNFIKGYRNKRDTLSERGLLTIVWPFQ